MIKSLIQYPEPMISKNSSWIGENQTIPSQQARPEILVVIDPQVENYSQLAAGVIQGVQVLILESHQDSIAQISEFLANAEGIKSLHIVSHGLPGCLQLGKTQLSLDNLEDYRQQLQTWPSSLQSILLYGCQVAQGEVGQTFVQQLSQLTEVPIAASSTLVGNPAKQGNWELDVTTGKIEASLAFQPQVLANYPGTFAIFVVDNGDVSGAPASFDAATQTWTGGGLVGVINQANDETNFAGADIIQLADGGNYNFTTIAAATDGFQITSGFPIGASALPIITSEITIDGNGATLAGNNSNFRLFSVLGGTTTTAPTVDAAGNLTLNNLTLTGGATAGSSNQGVEDDGGGVLVYAVTAAESAILNVNNSTITGNTANDDGGGISNTYGTVFINNSTITNNTATGDSSTGSTSPDQGGAIENDGGTVTITGDSPGTVITGNNLTDTNGVGGGISSDTAGIPPVVGTLQLAGNVTIDSNTSSGSANNLNIEAGTIINATTGALPTSGITNNGTTNTISGIVSITPNLDTLPSEDPVGTGTNGAFTINLSNAITTDVVVSIGTSGTATVGTDYTLTAGSTELTLDSATSPTTLTIASGTAAGSYTINIVPVDDAVFDPGETVTLALNSITTAGFNLGANSATVEIIDNESAITVSPTTLTTQESGTTGTFTVTLEQTPTAEVTLALTNGDPTEGSLSATTLTFAANTTDLTQTVTVTGVDDTDLDGDITYTITTGAATSTDTTFSGIDPNDVVVTNIDNDVIAVAPTTLTTAESGTTATFTVTLSQAPTADVTLNLSGVNTNEGSLSATTLTFAANTTDLVQTVTVTGVDDTTVDGDQTYTITTDAATSTDTTFSGIDPDDVVVTNTDNDLIAVSPTTLTTSETGTTGTFTVTLASTPAAEVTLGLTNGDPTEGSLSAATLTFAANTTDLTQTVTVTGLDDSDGDGNITYTVTTDAATSTDTTFNGFNPDDVVVTNNDDEASITATPTTLTTSETGTTGTFTVTLTGNPTSDVTVALTGVDDTEGTLSATSLTFSAAGTQTVTVTGVDDSEDDGDVTYTIATDATSADGNFNGLAVDDVTVTNTDDDATITVTPTTLTTSETGTTGTFTVTLSETPTAEVTLGLTNGDATEGSLSATTLTFAANTTDLTQTVTVTGVDDTDSDGAQTYTIVTAAATSTDIFNGIDPDDVVVTNNDDDIAPAVTVTPTTGLTTTEAGGTATFTVALTTLPTADVTLGLTSSDTTEGTLSANTLTFTNANGTTAQTVTVTGIDDNIDDGDIAYSIVTANTVSTDTNYSGLTVDDVTVTNTDDDQAPEVLTLTKDDSNIFTVGGTAGQNTTFTFDLTASSGDFTNEVFVIRAEDAAGTVGGLAPGDANYLSNAFANGQGEVIFSTLANSEFSSTFDFIRSINFNAQQNLVFGLVQNSSVETFISSNSGTVFFADTNAIISNFADDGTDTSFTIGFEDLAEGAATGDNDDVQITVTSTANTETTGTTFQGTQQGELFDLTSFTGNVTATFTVQSEAAFDNFVGFYQVQNAAGDVLDEFGNTVSVGDANYFSTATTTALVDGVSLTSSTASGTTFTITGNAIYAPFIVADGDLTTATADNTFFTYIQANTLGADQIRLLGDNIFGFEDIAGGGDNDFNDIVVAATFA